MDYIENCLSEIENALHLQSKECRVFVYETLTQILDKYPNENEYIVDKFIELCSKYDNMPKFYHASKCQYAIGKEFSTDDFEGDVTFDYMARDSKDQEIYDMLDSYRPEGYHSRKKCIYLFDDKSACTLYAHKDQLNIYQVIPYDVMGPFPFHLVTAFKKFETYREQIAKEYWQSTETWKFNEYICTKMQIIKIDRLCGALSSVGNFLLSEDRNHLYNWLKIKEQSVSSESRFDRIKALIKKNSL